MTYKTKQIESSASYHEQKFREHDEKANELHQYVGGSGSNHNELMQQRDYHMQQRELHRKKMIAAATLHGERDKNGLDEKDRRNLAKFTQEEINKEKKERKK